MTDRLTVEHKYLGAVLGMPGATEHPLLAGLNSLPDVNTVMDRATFMDTRPSILRCEPLILEY
jgi:hypothetical protein